MFGGTPSSEVSNDRKEAPAEFYITEDCNGCGLCKSAAPGFFDCVEFAYSYFITRQPQTEREVEFLKGAASVCDLDAIQETTSTSYLSEETLRGKVI